MKLNNELKSQKKAVETEAKVAIIKIEVNITPFKSDDAIKYEVNVDSEKIKATNVKSKKQLTFLELAEKVLEKIKKPMSAREMWERSKEMKISFETNSITPWKTLYAVLYLDITNSSDKTIFYCHSKRPTRFYLKKYQFVEQMGGIK